MKRTMITLVLLIVLLFGQGSMSAQALDSTTAGESSGLLSGMPNSAQFGFGARYALQNTMPGSFLSQARAFGLDWIAIPVDWASLSYAENGQPDLSAIALAVQTAKVNEQNVMLVVSQPPTWAMTPAGPSPEWVAALVNSLGQAMPGQINALELFPGANTVKAWGVQPSAADYLKALQAARQALVASNPGGIVLPSLMPLTAAPAPGDISETVFLNSLYQNGLADLFFPVLGLHYPAISGQPTDSAPAAGITNAVVLRRYEMVRDVMLDYKRNADLIWITNFSWPAEMHDQGAQAQWLANSFRQLQAQLFIGAAFFNSLNDTSAGSTALIDGNLTLHPALEPLRTLAISSTTLPPSTIYSTPETQAAEKPVGFFAWLVNFIKSLFT